MAASASVRNKLAILGLREIHDSSIRAVVSGNLLDRNNLLVRIKDIEKQRDDFVESYIILETSKSEELNLTDLENKYKSFMNMYFEIHTNYLAVFPPKEDSIKTSNSHGFSLPKISLPTFSGGITEWINFINTYDAIIHNNESLSDIHKMHYLLGALSGDALNIIKHLPVSAINYPIAYNLLRDRFHNKRIIADRHVENIISCPIIKKDSLRSVVNVLKENIQALEALHFPTDQWSFLLLHIVLKKIPDDLRTNFEIMGHKDEIPSFSQLLSFLESQCKIYESVHEYGVKNQAPKAKPNRLLNSFVSTQKSVCLICKGGHFLSKCDQFLKLQPPARFDVVKKYKLCQNCLSAQHLVKNCSSRFNCFQCHKNHHSLLHFSRDVNRQAHASNSNNFDNTSRQEVLDSPPDTIDPIVSAITATTPPLERFNNPNVLSSSSQSSVLLATAIVEARDKKGNFHKVRVLLDCASQANFISNDCAIRLGLDCSNKKIPIRGIGQLSAIAHKGLVKCRIRPLCSNELFDADFVVLSSICAQLPSSPIRRGDWDHLKNLTLADPNFDKPSTIDILLGAGLFSSVLRSGRVVGKSNEPIALNTAFGWILMGNVDHSVSPVMNSFLTTSESTIETILKTFWEIEDLPNHPSPLSTEELLCEKIFSTQHYRDDAGRYVVPLPFREVKSALGDSYHSAVSRLHHLERRFSRHPDIKSDYIQFMREYESLGHMIDVTSSSVSTGKYFIPHHCVIKDTGSMKKLRVVFDASSKTSSNQSLNDILLVGPKLQQDIVKLISNFRTHKIVFTTDICKMYRQILVRPEDRSYQHILWRESPEQMIKEFELQTVTYGTVSAPFLAIRSLQQLALDADAKFSTASKVLLENTYVDDILAGASTLESARKLQRDLVELLNLGGFELSKWSSNCRELLSDIPISHQEAPIEIDLNHSNNIKILGIVWDSQTDSFSYRVKTSQITFSKRSILSTIAKIFDPLGWISPVTFLAKCLLQQLWKLGLNWDDPVPVMVQSHWTAIVSSLSTLANIQIPRYLGESSDNTYQLVGFADASERGYACVVYIRSQHSKQEFNIRLLVAKSKVAPVKTLSIPRLELCGALLLARLLDYVLKSFGTTLHIDKVFAFTDSSIVLSWIHTPTYNLQTFVANRIEQINEVNSLIKWFHIRSHLNPADVSSRGLLPDQLVNTELWWKGPPWMLSPVDEWPLVHSFSVKLDVVPELKANNIHVLTTTDSWNDEMLNRFSSLTRLQRVTAWILRFAVNIRKKKEDRIFGILTVEELHSSLKLWILKVQRVHFHIDAGKNCRNSSHVRKLMPFLDPVGLLRVGGRLHNAPIASNFQHPILLPKKSHLTNLIIDSFHKTYLHVGPRTLLSILQSKYWIVSARNVIRSRLSKCITCFKARPVGVQPMMGDLPQIRFREGRPFLNVGVDFGGPFSIKESRRRGAKVLKAYLCLFICLSTKAVHLEVVSDLSSDAFLAALDRFLARRGLCSCILSDNGTNFVGANKYLSARDYLTSAATTRQIKWYFHPPSAPHFGGIYEAGIKSSKYHLKRVIGEQVLTFEELATLFSRIEAILNSRPLSQLSSDPSELEALTPGHFLIGAPLTSVPEPDWSEVPMNRLSRWQLLQKITQAFWNRWRKEYLHTLQQRGKWITSSPNLNVGDLVLLNDGKIPSMHWPLGRIEECHPGPDQIVRVVTVKTAQGTFRRPVVKLYPLPL